MWLNMFVQALLCDNIDLSSKRCFQILDELHVANHPSRTAQAHQDIHVALRPVLAARDASEYSGVSHAELREYWRRPALDFLDGHTSVIPLHRENRKSRRGAETVLVARVRGGGMA